MHIYIKKFGEILTSRQDGKEALAAFNPTLVTATDNEEILIDFDGVVSFTPSWGDEFITPLYKRFGDRVKLINTVNSSVQATISLLEQVNGYKLRR
ncbi:MAG: hypothetical protein A2445_02760 [Candidatus Jacksonbacteria bacterium RIFOXYC2_FULL_44_29]|nr:MAG: hypothetical protein UV19_C0002G0054 [Parcubacteria group bacterium GW2011_GWA2_42_28]KKT55922.1 MAG: hypothetical protein UW45_C0003G0055 [Parcubacteria group bacterium GW2011_GWC2_44_22]OGY74534.1 MAG: hypothetical protein A2240_03015 [Candidatus Jacksonbacteria bacterium RIFOXYA2_FULL_43_12]OGY77444.1 MAG: hypothetical protein A2295_01965 [Candidatus Jacksonbacteria bacterium RIFOXYB2_FULL_44_15]OGY78216.1 MAG: hypothetical protein A2550_06310 [Candidatus Jacksonbacteria bacterium RI